MIFINDVDRPETSAPKSLTRKIIDRTAYGLAMALLLAFLAVEVIGLVIYGSRADRRTDALQARFPYHKNYLVDYMARAGLTYHAETAVTIGPLTTMTKTSISGGGFSVLGTGRTNVSGSSNTVLVRTVSLTYAGRLYSYIVPATSGITINNHLARPQLRLKNSYIDEGQRLADCTNDFWPPYKIHCSIDPASTIYDAEIIAAIKRGGMAYVFAHYPVDLVAPASSIP